MTASENDQEIKSYIDAHEKYIKQIQELDNRIDHLAPYEIAKMEYLYSKAERQAWVIAAYHKRNQKYYEGMAEIKQGLEYQAAKEEGRTGTDAQYLSRITKGKMLCEASRYEGDYISWRGIAQTYERAAHSLKDVMRAIQEQGGH